jgi:hypothetical protein
VPLFIRIDPFESIDLTEAEPHRMMLARALLQRVLGKAMGHIDRPHLDAVLAGVTDDLRRRIESHRLGIQQRAAERIGMKPFQP